MAIDAIKNFAKGDVSTGYSSSDVEIILNSGHGLKFPDPSTDGSFNVVWWNSTLYKNPGDDPSVEIVRCTTKSIDTLGIIRAQEGTSASNKNTTGSVYSIALTITKKTIDDIKNEISSISGVAGPATAVDSNFAAFDTTTGKLIKDSGKKASDFQTALGFTAVPNTRTVNTKALSANIVLTPDDLDDSTTSHKFVSAADVTSIATIGSKVSKDGASTTGNLMQFDSSGNAHDYGWNPGLLVPATRTVNTKSLGANIVLTPDDLDDTSTSHRFVSATDVTKLANTSGTNSGDNAVNSTSVPTTRTVNTKALSANVVLTPDDLDDTSTAHKFTSATEITKLAGIATSATANAKITGATLDALTDDTGFVTAKAIQDGKNVPHVAPGTSGNVCTSNGTDWISQAPAASGATSADIQTFTSNSTWTKPANAKSVYIMLIGGGGGGGGGSVNNSSSGGGGGGGQILQSSIPAALLSSTVSITIGAGGLAANSNPSGNGSGGASGNPTLFGSYLSALGGGGGGGTNGTIGGGGGNNALSGILFSGGGGVGGNNSQGGLGSFGGGGGGGGQYNNGGNGASGSNYYASGGGGGGYNSYGSGGTQVNGTPNTNFPIGGAGGKGAISTANGADGGLYGGGGGGGTVNTTYKGGNGGQGIAVIITYF